MIFEILYDYLYKIQNKDTKLNYSKQLNSIKTKLFNKNENFYHQNVYYKNWSIKKIVKQYNFNDFFWENESKFLKQKKYNTFENFISNKIFLYNSKIKYDLQNDLIVMVYNKIQNNIKSL